MIVTLRKASLWTAIVGFCFFAAGHNEAALVVRFVTECLRLPFFCQERIRDQAGLSIFIMCGCVFGLIRIRTLIS